jgi:pyruvate dehydrogenase E1 component alpha subunit
MDPEAVSEAASRAAARVRETGLPSFLEFRTYRFRAHSMFDPELYRDKKEVAYFKEKDPIPAWIATLKARGDVTDAQVKAMDAEAEQESAQAVAFAEAGTWETYEEMASDVTTRR